MYAYKMQHTYTYIYIYMYYEMPTTHPYCVERSVAKALPWPTSAQEADCPGQTASLLALFSAVASSRAEVLTIEGTPEN